MSRRKQTNPRAIKRDVSPDEDESLTSIAKKSATESIRSDSVDSTQTIENEAKNFTIKCDSCQELFLTSEQFNQHRLYQCSFLLDDTNSDESRVSSYDDYAHQIETIPYGSSQNEEYPHPCSYCQKSFSNMALLLKHEQIHVELMPFRCSFCGKGFKHRRSLNRHLKLHTGERKFKCNSCESTFARSDHLKAHIRTHNNNSNTNSINTEKPMNVEFQLTTPTQSKSDVDEHTISSESKLNKDDKKTAHCSYCPRVCLGEDSLRSHIQTEHSQPTTTTSTDSNPEQIPTESPSPIQSDTYCHLCNAKFNNRENYYAHIRCTHPLFHPKLDQTPPYPNLPLKNSSEKFTDSILNDYALIERTIWCEKCKHSFDSMTIYLQHYSFQHCLQIIKCLQCQDVFETLELFFNHVERIHPSKTVETLKCKLCNATYKQRSDFLHHIQTVHKTSSYPCSLCSCQCNSMNDLLDHLKSMHKIQPNFDLHSRRPSFNTLFSCQFCSKKFPSRFDLNQHCANEHNDEKKDSPSIDVHCASCDLNFPSETLLLEHNKHIHRSASLSSTFQCTYCHAIFTSRTQLDRHSRIHIASSGHNLKCNICDRLFPTVESLSEHKLSHCKATSSNLCSYCHEILTNEIDYTRHLYEHNQISTSKSKISLFATTNESKPMTITCIVCKQSLINEHEIDLHAKFHLKHLRNEKPHEDHAVVECSLTCRGCQRSSPTNRDYLLEFSTFHLFCFQCIEKDLKCSDAHVISDEEVISTALSCPKCQNNVEFDSMKTYQQHFTSVHSKKQSSDEYQCFKCNQIVSSREHVLQHQKKLVSPPSRAFLIDSSRCSSPPRVHFCYLCRRNFDTAMRMHIHLLEHQYPNRDYQCSVCEQCSFDDASQLYQHMVQHGSKARLHPCRECDVYFMFSIHLINHQYSHEEDLVVKTSSKKKYSMKSMDEEEDNLCKSIVTRSATKRTCRSVIVS